jgi:hypothetical protein
MVSVFGWPDARVKEKRAKALAKLKPWPIVRNIVEEIFVIFPCLQYLETLAFINETKVASRQAKIFSTKFRNI